MMQSLPNTNLNPFQGQSSPYKALPLRAASFANATGSTSGGTVSSRQIEKFETRLRQTEQSNQVLLEQLMRMQNEMKSAARKSQQTSEEERQVRQQTEQSLRSLQGRLSDAEERARRAEQTTAETKASLAQLVDHTKNVERTIAASQQGLMAKKDMGNQKLLQIRQDLESFGNVRDQLEKSTWNMKQQFQELMGKVQSNSQDIKTIQGSLKTQIQTIGEQTNANLTKQDSQTKNTITNLQNAIQELRTKLTAEQKAREQLQQQLKGRNLNEIENNLTKNSENVLQHIKKLETADIKGSEAKIQRVTATVVEMDAKLMKATSEMEKVLAAEIQTRRDQGKLLKMKVYECNDNLRAGLSAVIHEKKPPNGAANDASWKLDAVKVHQISQEAAEDVRKELEQHIKDLQKQQKSMDETMNKLKKGIQDENKSVDKGKLPSSTVITPRASSAGATPIPTAKTDPKIVGDKLDQRLDYILFNQEKLKKQVNEMQQEINRLVGKQSGSLEDHFSGLDRRMTARMDAETRNRNKDVQLLKDDVELLRRQHMTTTNQSQSASSEDVRKLKQDMAQTKTSFRKMAESIQVVKTTLGDKLTEEARIRKEETGRLQSDMTRIKNWMQKSQ